ncbi:LytR C-terminal domain-containing protein [Streptacidiphilus anmyonensis]|uniref:LytR C-terminal domain-containing protein n=1 Tax=Streptacidiphilus anmyonensis TaxID=405782 RepID=UPI0007C8010A|nr:LytR C-terminal domain-containing protein [Streptacidiphilus anmyonensis]
MLTPPGLKGKQYRISGKAYPRLARPGQKRRRVFQVIGAVVALALIGWGTVQLVTVFGSKKKPTAAADGHCVRPATAKAAGDAAKPSANPDASASASASGPAASGSAAPSASASAAASAAASLMALPAGVPQPSTFTVNVYNATSHAGLAGATAKLLAQRGFKIGKVANAPAQLEGKVTGTAQVMGANASKAAMQLVGSEVSGAGTTTDTRTDGSVDLVIGNGFTALQSPAQAAQALSLAVNPSPSAGAHC